MNNDADKQRRAYAKDTKSRLKNQGHATEVASDYLTGAYAEQVLTPLKKQIAAWADRVMQAHRSR